MSEAPALVELDDRWLLPYGGMHVHQVRVSYQLTLSLDNGALVDIESEAILMHAAPDGGRVAARLEPERQDVAPALSLFLCTITSAVALKSGTLQMSFSDGAELTVEPHKQYEAWGATGPDGLRFVAMPGGGLAVWH